MQSKNNKKQTINIDFNASVITPQTLVKIVLSIIDFLAFHRKTIPFVYQQFKYMVEKFKDFNDEMDEMDENWHINDRLNRQRVNALETLKNLREFKKIISYQIETIDCTTVVLLFGGGSMCDNAREAYFINLPKLTEANHYAQNHLESDTQIVRKIIMSIVSAQEQFEIKNKGIVAASATLNNMFFMLKTRCKSIQLDPLNFIEQSELYPMSHSTHEIIFNLNNINKIIEPMNCCQELVIFDDLKNKLHICNDIDNDKNEKISKKTIRMKNTDKMCSCGDDCFGLVEDNDVWHECLFTVKGFKNIEIKGGTIW